MTDTSNRPRPTFGAPAMGGLALAALFLRVAAADLVQWYSQHKGQLCVFPDSFIYWQLAGKLRRGEPYEIVEFADLPYFSLRTPGYPVFLAGCQWLFGERVLPVRLVQSLLGAGCVWLMAWLARRALPGRKDLDLGRGWTVPLVAAALVAVEPYTVANSAFVLSEALFVPLLLLTQWGLSALWADEGDEGLPGLWAALAALGTGAAWGAAVLVRPAWWLYVPSALGAWLAFCGHGARKRACLGAACAALGLVLVMSPWWVRNYRVYGRFVPTALWMGASLYDGLSPRATGASDMSFRFDPDVWPLGEEGQDAALRERAWEFARENPGRVLALAAVKAGRFWSPWPNAEGFRSLPLAVASTAITLPVLVLMAVGAWDRRRDPRALALLALPMLYTFAVHLLFVSSMRYRVPVEVPALGLSALGWARVSAWRRGA